MSATPRALLNLVHIHPRGEVLGKWVKCNQIFSFIYTLFLGAHLQVRPVDGFSRMMAQNDADSCKDVLFGFVDMASHLGGQIFPNPHFGRGAWVGDFKITLNLKNPRWPRPPSWKIEKLPYLGSDLTDQREIWHGDAVFPSWPFRPLSRRWWMIMNSDGRNVDAAKLRNHEFHNGFARVCTGCRTNVIFLLLTKFLRNMSHLFMLSNDYLTIAKLWSVLSSRFHQFILGSFENWVPVITLINGFTRLTPRVHFPKQELIRRWHSERELFHDDDIVHRGHLLRQLNRLPNFYYN